MAVGISKRVLGADHPDTLSSMKQGRWEAAEKLEVEVMETRKTKLGMDHPDTLTSMGNLAHTWWDAGKGVRAADLMRECVIVQEKKFGSTHSDTRACLSTLHAWETQNSSG